MLAILENPAVRERVVGLSLEDYHRVFASRDSAPYELIRGAIIQKMPQSALHASILLMLRKHVEPWLPSGYHIREEKPLTFTDSEPEPDFAVIAEDWEKFLDVHPRTAELVVEVAVSSEGLDRLKAELYAEAGIREFWLVLPKQKVIERHTEPSGSTYGRVERTSFHGSIPSTVFAELPFPPPSFSRIA